MGPILGLLIFVSIIGIVFSSVKWQLHPFVSLTLASLFFGVFANFAGYLGGASQQVIPDLAKVYAQGFGGILSGIGLVIIFGTLLGKVLEKSGGAEVMAHRIVNWVGVKNSAWAMSLIGWVVSIPVFCDSGYILLTSLKKSLAQKAKLPLVVLSVALATGLYSSHTFIPPTPGPIVAAANLGIDAKDFIWVILFGGGVSFVVMLVGSLWAQKMLPRLLDLDSVTAGNVSISSHAILNLDNSFLKVITPMLLPIVLIALSSVAAFPVVDSAGETKSLFSGKLLLFAQFLGHPFIALVIGYFTALVLLTGSLKAEREWVNEALKEAAMILLITGAGGGFGAMIKASPLAEYIQGQFGHGQVSPILGLWILFVIAALLKTAQGSSTAALVITSSLAVSLLDAFGLGFVEGQWIPFGPVLSVLAIGAGAMVVSHVNDSYFWVVTQFSGLTPAQGYKSQTLATLVQGFVGILVISILAAICL